MLLEEGKTEEVPPCGNICCPRWRCCRCFPFRTEKDLLRVPDLNPALLDILMLEEKDGDLVYEADAYVSMPTY